VASLNEILGIILVIFGIWFFLKNKDVVFSEFKINFFEIDKIIGWISLFLIIIGIILIFILW